MFRRGGWFHRQVCDKWQVVALCRDMGTAPLPLYGPHATPCRLPAAGASSPGCLLLSAPLCCQSSLLKPELLSNIMQTGSFHYPD